MKLVNFPILSLTEILCLHAALNKSAHYNQCNRRVESAVLSVTGMVQLMSDGSDSWRLI